MTTTIPSPLVIEGVKKCSRCHEWKPPDDFSASSDTPDGSQYWCKQCIHAYQQEHRHSPTLKALSDTLSLRETNALLARRIPAEIRQHVRDLMGSDPVAKARAQEVERKRNAVLEAGWDRAIKMRKAMDRETRKERLLNRIDRLVKAIAIKRAQEAGKAELAKAMAKKKAAQARLAAAMAENAATLEKAAAMNEQVTALRNHIAAVNEDADNRITRMLAVLDQHNAELAKNDARRTAWEAQRVDRDRQEWIFKASTTEDAILRSVYLARADGEELEGE